MKVLHVTNKPVFPAVDGGSLAMQRTLECLESMGYDVVQFCISTQKHPLNQQDYPEGFILHSVNIDTRLKPVNALLNLVIGRSYHLSRFRSELIREKLLEVLSNEEFNVVLFESIYSALFINDIRNHTKAKLWIRTHNVEYQIWKDVAIQESNPLRKWYLKLLSSQLQKEEIELLNSADGLMAISEVDKAQFEKLRIKPPIEVIQVPFSSGLRKTNYTSSTFYFIGSMNWEPNREAVDLLVNSIWPSIKEKISDAKLILVGKGMEEIVNSDPGAGIKSLGFVEDLNQIYLNEGIFLCPIYSGSGVRIKLLEAMSKGVPIITSKKGAEGIISDRNIFLEVQDFFGFAKAAIELASDVQLRKSIGDSAFEFIRENYSLDTVSKRIDGIFQGK